MNFVNQKLDRLGLSVQNLDTQVGLRLWGPQAGKGHGVQVRRRVPWGAGSRSPALCDPRMCGVLEPWGPPPAAVGRCRW